MGLSNYTSKDIFDRSLFTTIRYRMGVEEFDHLNRIIIGRAEEAEQKKKAKANLTQKDKGKRNKEQAEEKVNTQQSSSSAAEPTTSPSISNIVSSTTVASSEPTTSPTEATSSPSDSAKPTHSGKLQIDATVAEQMIAYPTDLGLLNTAREESERLIDALHQINSGGKKTEDLSQERPQAVFEYCQEETQNKARDTQRHWTTIEISETQHQKYP